MNYTSEIVFNNYFALPSHVKLHITPKYGILINKQANKGGVFLINSEATSFLSYANGTKTVREVLEQIYKSPFEFLEKSSKNKCIAFIADAQKKGHLLLNKFKKDINLDKTGNFAVFYPIHYMIELTYKCNLKCFHCYANAGSGKLQYVNKNQLLKFLKASKENGLFSIELTGGEPFCYPYFSEILNFCTSNLKFMGILTNGTLIEKNKELLIKYKQYNKRILFSVSLYGPSPEIHERITKVKGSFKNVLQGIKILLELGYFVRVSMTLVQENVDYLEETLDLAHEIGVKAFSWDNVQPTGRGKTCSSNYNLIQLQKIHSKDLVEKHQNFVVMLTKEQLEDRMRFGNCGAGHKNIVIDPKGNVIPCCFIHDEFIPFGNIEVSPEEVFNSPEVRFWANIQEPNVKICEDCEHLPYCSGCPVRAIFKMQKKGKICKWGKIVDINNHLNNLLN
jgi:radical SAM protein with 4Fe4S-binding SPASM domain